MVSTTNFGSGIVKMHEKSIGSQAILGAVGLPLIMLGSKDILLSMGVVTIATVIIFVTLMPSAILGSRTK